MVSEHDGSVFALLYDGKQLVPDQKLPLPVPHKIILSEQAPPAKMLHLYMSNHTLGSLFYWMDQFRLFDYEFSRAASKDEEFRSYLLTECPGICAGVLFPTLGDKHPGSSVEIRVTTTSHPLVTIHEKNINISITSRIDGFVVKLDDPLERHEFVTAKIVMFSEIRQLRIDEHYNLTGKLELTGYELSDLETDIPEITPQSIDFLVTSMMDLFVKKDFTRKLVEGIKLPRILDFNLRETSVQMHKGIIELSTNFCSSEVRKSSCLPTSRPAVQGRNSRSRNTTPATATTLDYYEYEYSYGDKNNDTSL